MDKSNDTNVKQLNSFLRGEISAVETYNKAIPTIDSEPVRKTLGTVRDSHNERVLKLTKKIEALGGVPERESGIWGSFAKVVESAAAMVGTKTAVSTLEEGEDHGLEDYRSDISSLSPELQVFINMEMLPAQQDTHRMMNELQKRLN